MTGRTKGQFRFTLSCENLTWIAVAVGVILRVWEYVEFRELYMDEVSLLKNIVGKSLFDFHGVLEQDQMAPPGFLVLERLMVRLPLDVHAAARLLPLLCGVASVFLISLCREALPGPPRRAGCRGTLCAGRPLAVLFRRDQAIFMRPGSGPGRAYLAAKIASRVDAGPARGGCVFGLIAPWFSFSVVFVLAGVGLHLLATGLMQRDRKQIASVAAMGLAWLISFGGCFLLSRSILSKRDFIWVWWNFAFLPIPPRSWADCSLLAETLANVFINPGSLLSPLSLVYTAVAASVLAMIGCLSLARRWPGGCSW